jgi:uncharacterized phage infection (PIP) family protein YhgE
MIITQSHIDDLLAELKDTLEQINALRGRVTKLVSDVGDELDLAQQEYDARLSSLNAEARELAYRKETLKMRLNQLQNSQNSIEAQNFLDLDVPGVDPPEPELLETTETPESPEPPPEDPRIARKRALADHIYYFLEQDQEAVMQHVNAVLNKENTDIGHMLELLAWGDIWKARPAWESLEDQYQRLKGWQPMLKARLSYWKGEVQRLESEKRYALWKIKNQGEAHWQAYLDDLVEKQKSENAKLSHEVAVLEAELQDMELEEEISHG